MPGKRAVPKLEDHALFTITNLILSSAKLACENELAVLVTVDLQAAKQRSKVIGRKIIRYLSVLPSYLHHKISLLCFKLLTIDFTRPYYPSYDHSYQKFIQILAETLFTSRTEKVVSFSDFPTSPVHALLLKQLPTMCELRVLKIRNFELTNCFGLSIAPTCHNEDLIKAALFNMPYLQEFAFDHCTDNAIETISLSCKMIQKMNVAGSRKVTNACIPALCLCEQLKEFLFYHTAITTSGYEKLLLEHPRLETVDMVFIMSEGYLTVGSEDSGYFNSSTLIMRDKTLNMKNLCELGTKHPHITCLRVYLQFPKHLSILPLFPNVKTMVLFAYNCQRCSRDLHNVLRDKGDALTTLYFQQAVVDLNTLFISSRYCPNVTDLQFGKIHKVANTKPIEAFRPINTAPFLSTLKISVLLEEINNEETVARRQFIKFLLSHCINIQSIFIKGFDFDDELLHEIILSNPMKELQKLMILDTTHLTMNSLKLLMKKCDKLLYLKDLDKWNIDDATRQRFRNLLDCNNINLLTTYDRQDIPDVAKIHTILRFKKFYDRLNLYVN